jgi:hypothetical protein
MTNILPARIVITAVSESINGLRDIQIQNCQGLGACETMFGMSIRMVCRCLLVPGSLDAGDR